MVKRKKKTVKGGLPVKNFDLRKRYDVYYQLSKGFAVCKNVRVKGKRTFEDTEDPRSALLQYLELEDSKGRSFTLHYLHISMICEAGMKVPFSVIKNKELVKKGK